MMSDKLFKKLLLSFFYKAKRFKKASPVKLEFGCGPSLTSGFEGCDIRWFPGVQYICNAWEITTYVKPGVVEEIYSRHFLEHLTFPQAELTIKAWIMLLRSTGVLRVCVPDIDYHIEQFQSSDGNMPSETNPSWTLHQHALAGFWGWQREGEKSLWDVHKSGYNYAMLRSKLMQHGYIEVERIPDKPWNLHVRAIKP